MPLCGRVHLNNENISLDRLKERCYRARAGRAGSSFLAVRTCPAETRSPREPSVRRAKKRGVHVISAGTHIKLTAENMSRRLKNHNGRSNKAYVGRSACLALKFYEPTFRGGWKNGKPRVERPKNTGDGGRRGRPRAVCLPTRSSAGRPSTLNKSCKSVVCAYRCIFLYSAESYWPNQFFREHFKNRRHAQPVYRP